MYKYDLMVYIGRFQPLHNGHIQTIRLALKDSRRLIILIGSHNAPTSIRNPWTTEERQTLIRESLSQEEYNRCLVAGLEDYLYSEQKWVKRIEEIVHGFRAIYGGLDSKIGITGFDKDSTTYYLQLFPAWQNELKPQIERVNATQIRECLFDSGTILTDLIPENVAKFLIEFRKTDRCKHLLDEYKYIKDYKESWANTPYPVTFNTVDIVYLRGTYVLLVKRKGYPGKGLWALPGGFIHNNETLLDAAKRELKEETNIVFEDKHIIGTRTFDDPNRSARGRVITTAFYVSSSSNFVMNDAIAGDDAEEVKFVALSSLNSIRSSITEDHYHIIDYFCNLKKNEY